MVGTDATARPGEAEAEAMSDAEERWLADLFYRQAYGIANELAREHRQGDHWREDASARILASTLRELTPFGTDLEPAQVELVREAVGDAVAKRRPRW